eukprot:CAMPEP_0170303392 /NCGR_PEP_ID=MMETSP0116_2-20130129/52010_1 /TAXON_ID=400756 /ORGANISM="Durinskia baltica, Strain CSIRO CS-38" /LENGTH=39 /DNA_ID= /DNA_START= /DNA_END= /DNA_ORIENTATION=
MSGNIEVDEILLKQEVVAGAAPIPSAQWRKFKMQRDDQS